MFKDSRVQELDLSGFKMRADANLSQMFGYMYSLNKVYVSENWSDIVKTDCLPFWACTGLTGSQTSQQEGLDMANCYMYSLNKVYVSENWSDIVKTDCLPFWACTGLTGSQTSQQEGLDMANYDTGYFTFKQMEAK